MAAWANGPRGRPGALPRSNARTQTRLGTHRRDQRKPQSRGHLLRRDAARRRPADDEADRRSAVLADHGGDPRRRRAGPDVGRHHEHGQVGRAEGRDGGVGGVARKVAHHRLTGPAARLEHGGDRRRGRSVLRPVARQHGQLAGTVDGRGGQRGVQGGGRHAAAADTEAGPAQSVEVLGAEHEVQAAAEGVAVDEQDALAAAHRRDRRGDRQHRRPRAPAAADHGEDGASAPSALGRLRQGRHQPRFGLGQRHHVLGAHRDRLLPHRRWWRTAHRDDHAPAAGEPALGARAGGRRIEQDQRGLGPVPPRLRGIDRSDQLAPGGRRHAEQGVEQFGVRRP